MPFKCRANDWVPGEGLTCQRSPANAIPSWLTIIHGFLPGARLHQSGGILPITVPMQLNGALVERATLPQSEKQVMRVPSSLFSPAGSALSPGCHGGKKCLCIPLSQACPARPPPPQRPISPLAKRESKDDRLSSEKWAEAQPKATRAHTGKHKARQGESAGSSIPAWQDRRPGARVPPAPPDGNIPLLQPGSVPGSSAQERGPAGIPLISAPSPP